MVKEKHTQWWRRLLEKQTGKGGQKVNCLSKVLKGA